MTKTRITFAVPDDLYEAGRAIADKRGISMAQRVRDYLLQLAAQQQQTDRGHVNRRKVITIEKR